MVSSTLSDCLSHEVDIPAIIIPRQPTPIVLSHRELRQHVLSFQKNLAAIGITRNDAVAIALPNSLECVIAFLATSLQRAFCAPLNPAYRQNEFEFYLNDLSAALVLVPKGAIAGNGEAIKAARASNTAIAEISWDGYEVTLPNIELRGLAGRAQAGVNIPETQDIALILHTSGTTGRPKAVCVASATCRSLRSTHPAPGTINPQEFVSNHGQHSKHVCSDIVGSNPSGDAAVPCSWAAGWLPSSVVKQWVGHCSSPFFSIRVLARLCQF